MADDKLTVILAGIQERAEQLTASHADEDCPDADTSCTGHDALRLVAAVKVARRYHWPEYTSWGDVCGGCWTGGGSHPIWPCAPMADIVDALLGERKD